MNKRRQRQRQRAALVGAGIALVLVLAAMFLLPVERWIATAGASLAESGLAGAAAYAMLFVIRTMMFLPVYPFSFVAGLLYGPWGMGLAWLCIVSAAAISLPIARHLLRDRAETMLSHRPRLRVLSEVVADEGWRAVLLFRLSPGAPCGVKTYILAATRVRYLPFLVATSVGVLPGVAISAGAGAFGHSAIEGVGLGRYGVVAAGILTTLTLVILLVSKARRRLSEYREPSGVP